MKLYHYCSIATLFSIIKNESIWFSDLKNSNDYLEDKYIFNLFIDYLYNKYCKNDLDTLITKLNEKEFTKAKEQTSIYGFCLTENCDELIQWMAYGESNSVCIEFDYDELQNHFQHIKIFDNEPAIEIKKVNYFSSDDFLDNYFKQLLLNNECPCNCYKDLITISLNTKKICWKGEKEHRIVFRNFVDKGCNPSMPPVFFIDHKCKLDYIIKNDVPVFHYEIPFNIKLIKKIIIGPNSSLSINDLKNKLILTNEKFNADEVDFTITEISYR